MARPLQLEFAGIFYHITSRADRREAIDETDADRVAGSGMRMPLLAMPCLLLGGQDYALNDMQRFAKPYCRSGPGSRSPGEGVERSIGNFPSILKEFLNMVFFMVLPISRKIRHCILKIKMAYLQSSGSRHNL
jgi:hypothetical protein